MNNYHLAPGDMFFENSDICNDCTFPDSDKNALLVKSGTRGFSVDAGRKGLLSQWLLRGRVASGNRINRTKFAWPRTCVKRRDEVTDSGFSHRFTKSTLGIGSFHQKFGYHHLLRLSDTAAQGQALQPRLGD